MNHWLSGVLHRSLKINECPAARHGSSLTVAAGVMRSSMFSSSVAAVQGMMAWLTRSQMARLGTPAAACWHDTHVTAEILSSLASARTFRHSHPSPLPLTPTSTSFTTEVTLWVLPHWLSSSGKNECVCVVFFFDCVSWWAGCKVEIGTAWQCVWVSVPGVCGEIVSSLDSRALFQFDLIDSVSVSCSH